MFSGLFRHNQRSWSARAFPLAAGLVARIGVLAGALFAVACAPPEADEAGLRALVIGTPEEPQTLDPQYGIFGQIQQATTPMVFEPLFFRAPDGVTVYPLLATGARLLDPQRLEVALRRDVVFSDGSSFDAADVVYTFRRLPDPPGAGIPIKFIADALDHVEVIDSHTVVFHLTAPTPDFTGYLIEAPILSSDIGVVSAADFSSLEAAVGTGPYVFDRWDRGDKIEYAPNPLYWGAPAMWDRITLKFMPNHSARVAALIAGDIDVTNYIPVVDAPRLEKAPDVEVVRRGANRALYFHLDVERDVTPFVTDKAGRPIPNPLRDVRVRRALYLSLDRRLIVDKLLEGNAHPANQILAPGYMGHNADLPPPEVDVEEARALLREAGYEDGFRLVLHGTAGLYGPDVRVLQAMAAMWAKIGLDVEVEALPASVYWGPWFEREFSVALSSYGLHQHRIVPIYTATVASDGYDNVGGYVNDRVDALLAAAAPADTSTRQDLLAEAARILYDEMPILPLYHFEYLFAYRKGAVRYDPSVNLRDLEAMRAFPVSIGQPDSVSHDAAAGVSLSSGAAGR